MNNYLDFCKKCIRGEIPYQKKFYVLDNSPNISNETKDKNLDVTVVTPTQQAVEQAKNEVRQELSINRAKKRKIDQTGGRGDLNKNKKKKFKRNKENRKQITKRKTKKGIAKTVITKTKKKRKPKISTSYKAIWM